MPSRRGRPPHPEPLTPAEAKALALNRDGLQNSEIAIRLGVSINTVRFHVPNLLAKSGLPDRVLLRDWRPAPDTTPRRLSAVAIPLLKPLGIVGGATGVFTVDALAIPAFRGIKEDPAPLMDGAVVAYPGAVVGILSRQRRQGWWSPSPVAPAIRVPPT